MAWSSSPSWSAKCARRFFRRRFVVVGGATGEGRVDAAEAALGRPRFFLELAALPPEPVARRRLFLAVVGAGANG